MGVGKRVLVKKNWVFKIMLLIKTKIGLSKIHGIGLFVDQFVPKGKIIWKFEPGLDLAITKKQLNYLPKLAQKFIKHYGYLSSETNRYILSFDNDRFTNHFKNANTCMGKIINSERIAIAARNIKKGEEIIDNYDEYEPGKHKF